MHLLAKHKKEVIKKNKTTLFLLPLIGMNYQEDYKQLMDNGFVNAYLGDDNYDIIIEDNLFLLFNPFKFTKEFEWYCERLRNHPLFSYEYDCPDNPYGKVVFVFRIIPEYLSIVEKFKKGAYSKIDREYVKKWFPKYQADSTVSLRWKIFNKDPSLKDSLEKKLAIVLSDDAELYDIPDPNVEILNYNENKNKYW